MVAKCSYWQGLRKTLEVIGLIIVLVAAIALVLQEVILFGTGFKGKTLWDWLQLLIIPVVLALGGYFFTYTISKNERKAADRHNQTEREIAQDNQRETALQEYIDKMSELLLREKLRESQPKDEVRNIARVRTLTVLPRLDGHRKRSVLQFLYELSLIDKDNSIVNLEGADLTEINLRFGRMKKVNLSRTDMSKANMRNSSLTDLELIATDLSNTCLSYALLRRTNLSYAYLKEADMEESYFEDAQLFKANVTPEQLDKIKSLTGATMPDGSIHP